MGGENADNRVQSSQSAECRQSRSKQTAEARGRRKNSKNTEGGAHLPPRYTAYGITPHPQPTTTHTPTWLFCSILHTITIEHATMLYSLHQMLQYYIA